MERREKQKLNRKHYSTRGRRADNVGTTLDVEDFKLKVQNNSWMRIGQLSKAKDIVFNNLFQHFNVENLREAYHAQDGSKAVGIDLVTKQDYGRNLDGNLKALVDSLHKGTYRPQPKERIEIPKSNGKMRPIAIASFEDKLVEWVLNKIISTTHEPLFIQQSNGFRPKRSTFDAIKIVYQSLFKKDQNWVVDIDIASFFDTVPHKKLIKMLEKRISDRKILSLTYRFLEAGIMIDGAPVLSDLGVPQGGIVSPTLANIYLHHVLDTWFIANYTDNGGVISRYADDVVFTFKDEHTARDFLAATRKRLAEYNLQLNEDKSGLVEFRPKSGNTFNFTGFTFFWGNERGRKIKLLKVKTQKIRLQKAINEFTLWIKTNRGRIKLAEIWDQAAAKLRGHYNYFAVSHNRPKLNHYYYAVVGALFKWLNRRSQKKSYSWERFAAKLRQQPLPLPPQAFALKQFVPVKKWNR
jgi:hypothetical protein